MYGLRLRPGDDASCNNLYQPSQPRVLGVTPDFVQRFDNPAVPGFRWVATVESPPENPWRLLTDDADPGDGAIPTVLDVSTATYILKPPVGVGDIYEATYEPGKTLRFRIVGLLDVSILQGALVISEADLERCFPDVNGYRYFLTHSPANEGDESHAERVEKVARVLEDRLGDQGFDALPTYRLLERIMSVQNTYLDTFQSLGALGLLLGTFGLATVQVRNVLERRGELALLRAAGFRRSRLAGLVLWENTSLLVAGLATGVGAALVAVLPHKFAGGGSIPLMLLVDLGLMLGLVLLAGLVASLVSARTALSAPLLTALREE